MDQFAKVKERVSGILGGRPQEIVPFDEGVMNYTFSFKCSGEEFVLKINPRGREIVSLKERNAITLCKHVGGKVPNVIYQHSACEDSDWSFILYEKLEGKSLSQIFDLRSEIPKSRLIDEIVENYRLISSIPMEGYGDSNDLVEFDSFSWCDFILQESDKSFRYFKANNVFNDRDIKKLKAFMADFITRLDCSSNFFVWSDFNPSNIIVNKDGHLAGFVDFEGTMSGDPLLPIGYLFSNCGETGFYHETISRIATSENSINGYALFRLLRIMRYMNQPLPSGIKRDNIFTYLGKSTEILQKTIDTNRYERK